MLKLRKKKEAIDAKMAAAMLKQTRMTILLSLNAVAIVVAGVLIAGAIGLKGGVEFKMVDEKSEDTFAISDEPLLIDSTTDEIAVPATQIDEAASDLAFSFDVGTVSGSELWNATALTIYETANIDLCVNDSVPEPGHMYWQTSNTDVIKGFYTEARTRLGYNNTRCRYPAIVGTGLTTVTAGTYDGLRRDSIEVNVVEAPAEQWKKEVLDLVNKEREKVGLSALEWGDTCEAAAQTRAEESVILYEHKRPDGSSWDSVCQPMRGGVAGENLAAGNTAVSPKTVVQTWMNSDSHRANILSDKFTKMAVGFVFDPNSKYKTYWSQFFSNY